MAKIYIAHNYEARTWLRTYLIPKCFDAHEVTSQWIINPGDEFNTELQKAEQDLFDLDLADYLVLCVDNFSVQSGRGKWFEFGYAIAKSKPVIIVGFSKACVFVNLPTVVHVDTWLDAAIYLAHKDSQENTMQETADG